MAPLNTSTTNLTLSYDALEILGENDKSLFLHKRPLLNADTMVKKGHFKSALEIYYRAANKISNPEIQAKIQKNISDIHAYLKSSDPNSEKAFLEKYSDNREKEFTESLKELTENLSDSLTEKLNILKQIETVPGRPSSENPAYLPKQSTQDDQSEIKPLDLGSLDAKPKSKQEEKPSPEEEVDEIEGTLEYEEDNTDSTPKEKKPKKANIKVKKNLEDKASQVQSEQTEIRSDKTEIQNASMEGSNIQVGNQNVTNIESSRLENKNEIVEEPPIANKNDLPLETKAISSEPTDSKSNLPTEKRIVEEVRIIKEITEKIESPKSSTRLEPDIDLSHVETGWSELEKESPKPKADKDYAPLMKKYEVGNIEIPEATEFITGDFVPREAREERQQTSDKENKKDRSENTLREQPEGNQTGFEQEFPSLESGGSVQHPFNVPPLPPPMPLNINDWLSNLFFSKEWEQFKPLPMKERRSGKDRRTNTSNELPKGVKKERRSGVERRNQAENLLHAREAFLKDWHQSNQGYPHLSQPLKNYPMPIEGEHFTTEGMPLGDKEPLDPNLRSIEFLPRDPSSNERIPHSDELVKVELPDPEEIVLKPQLDQNEIPKEHISSDIAEPITKYAPANEELGLTESDKGLVKIDLPDPVLLKAEASELPHREVSGEIEVSSKDGTGIMGDAANKDNRSEMGPLPYTPEAYAIPEELKIELPDPDDFVRTKSGHLIDPFAPEETPEINMIEGDGPQSSEEEGAQISEIPELPPPPPEPERTIHGILELKPPEIDDAPFLTLTYDFSKIPHPFKLSKNYSIMEYSYYKYKPMLMKAQEFARRKMLKNALNYYRVIKSQNIPPELKNMINRNITDITEFLEKFIMSKGG